jgi:hypothetical protein
MALGLPFVTPTGYGLGKSGWVTATFGAKQRPNLPMLRQWIDESFRAIAPCKLHPPQGAPPEAARAKAVGKGSGKARRRAPAK